MNKVRKTLGWERIWVQIDSGAIDTVVPKETAKVFKTKEALMFNKGMGSVTSRPTGATSVIMEGRRSSVARTPVRE